MTPKKEENNVGKLVTFLVIIGLVVGGAVYYHFNRAEQEYSDVLFGFVSQDHAAQFSYF